MNKVIAYIILTIVLLSFYTKVNAQTDSVKVGFILASTFNDRWHKDQKYFKEKFNELGGKVIFVDCYDQVENQVSAAKYLIEQNVKGIVIVAIDASASAAAVEVANRAGIPVIAYDRIILKSSLDYYVSFNSIAVGEQMAKTIIEKLPSGNILYLGGPSEDYNSKLIRAGVFNVLDAHKNKYNISSVQASTWNQLDAYLVFQDYLSNSNPVPDAVICGADVLTRGVMDVLYEYDSVGKVILTGQDAELDICRMIIRDEVEMTVYKPIKNLASAAAEIMWKVVNKLEVKTNTTFYNEFKEVPSYLLNPIVVNKSNIDETIIKDGYYTKQEIYGE